MRRIISLNCGWSFSRDKIKKNQMPNFLNKWEKVNLPHTWNNLDGQDGGMDYYRGACWYKKTFTVNLKKNEEAYLEFKGANSNCTVFINGKKVYYHEGGFSTFRMNITPYLKMGKAKCLVRVDNSDTDHEYPQIADFTFFGGIYRDVNLICVPKGHFSLNRFGTSGVFVTPKLNDDGTADVKVKAYVSNPGRGKVVYRIDDMVCEVPAERAEYTFHIENPHLWNGIKDPFLYKLTAEYISENGETDVVTEKFGIRSFSVDSEKGFFLNGKRYPLHGVSRHQDRENIGWAIGEKEHREDMELISQVGANSVRLAHYQHAQEFYNLCDEYGMVVWAEIPFISAQIPGEEAKENTISQMTELILQNYNHPSVVCWGIANEITIGGKADKALLDNLRALNALCHKIDATRFTTIAQLSAVEMESPCNRITDVLSYNHYFGWYVGDVSQNGEWIDEFHKKYPRIPLGISEYGAEGILKYHTDTPKVQDYTEEYQAYYHEEMLKTFEKRPFLWSTYVWNMFDFASDMRDEGGVKGRNNKGLVTYDRKTKKDSFYLYKAFWSDEKFVHICSKRFAERAAEKISVKVYSNEPEVSLFVNDKLFGKIATHNIFVFEDVILKKGKNVITAKSGALEDSCEFIYTDTPNEEYVFKNDKAGTNVKNWFEDIDTSGDFEYPEGYYSIRDTVGDIMKSPEGKKLVDEIIEKAQKELNFKVTKSMLLMAKGFTVEKVISLAGSRIPESTALQANKILNKVKKK